jgi:hypothetical protein
MNTRNPKLWAIIGFGVGSVIAAAGSIATPLDSLIGGIIQALIWYGVSSLIIKKKTKNITIPNISTFNSKDKNSKSGLNSNDLSIKTCDNCNQQVQISKSWCGNCSGTSFTHKKILGSVLNGTLTSEEAMSEAFEASKDLPIEQIDPEFKTCPMCAEEIKYAAKKCRFCQHMLDA